VSPDGGSIAFVTSDLDSKTRIRVLTLGSGAWTQINLAESIRVSGKSIVRWSPGPSFLLTQHPTGLIRALWNGSDDGELRSWGSDPDVSVGGLVVYVRHGNLQVVEPGEGGGTRRLTRRGGTQPSWSPHQRQIAFTRKGWIYTVPLLGAPPTRLARGFQPTWSPDGKQIAFFRTDPDRKYFGDDATYLYVLNRRTGKVRRASSQVMALEDAYANATEGLDWQPAR
jgi:Tol biopolymer transport system component